MLSPLRGSPARGQEVYRGFVPHDPVGLTRDLNNIKTCRLYFDKWQRKKYYIGMGSWSYSMYSAAIKCLRYYKLVYVDKIPSPAPLSGDLAFGTSIHYALNSFLQGTRGELDFEIYWDSYQNKELNYGRFKWKELKDLGLNFCSKFERLHLKKYKLEMAEKRLYAEYKGVKFEGTPDFIGEYEGKRSLRDFKTSGYNYDRAKSDIALQLNLYAYLALQNGYKPFETLGYTILNKGTGSIQDLTWDFSEEKMYQMLDDLVGYCSLVDTQTEYYKNPNSCIMGSFKCDMFDICWKGKK